MTPLFAQFEYRYVFRISYDKPYIVGVNLFTFEFDEIWGCYFS